MAVAEVAHEKQWLNTKELQLAEYQALPKATIMLNVRFA